MALTFGRVASSKQIKAVAEQPMIAALALWRPNGQFHQRTGNLRHLCGVALRSVVLVADLSSNRWANLEASRADELGQCSGQKVANH